MNLENCLNMCLPPQEVRVGVTGTCDVILSTAGTLLRYLPDAVLKREVGELRAEADILHIYIDYVENV